MKPTTPTPVSFPHCAPQFSGDGSSSASDIHIVHLLRAIHRPSDIQAQHFEALKIHVTVDASPEQIIPDATFIAPVNDWTSLSPDDIALIDSSFRKPLSNGNLSPSLQTYIDRHKELSIENIAAFRTIRRIPPPSGEAGVRLGNAYEFYKNLDFVSGYWHDTSLPSEPESTSSPTEPSASSEETKSTPHQSSHLKTHQHIGPPSQLTYDSRRDLILAFLKLVTYDFGCNVSSSRVEPRMYLVPPSSCPTNPSSYFNSSTCFISRTPTERISARTGILEGPVAAVSIRTTMSFKNRVDSNLDFAREMVAVFLTAQYRARENKVEKRPWAGQWWAEKPRWGGGPGGPIGREVEAIEEAAVVGGFSPVNGAPNTPTGTNGGAGSTLAANIQRAIAASTSSPSSPSPSSTSSTSTPVPKRPKRAPSSGAYDHYRRLLAPKSNYDIKTRYSPIGKIKTQDYDDIFLISALNHHIAVMRVRVPGGLLRAFEGKTGKEADWERMGVWRSRWFDLFRGEERLQALRLVWGIMGFGMRAVEDEEAEKGKEEEKGGAGSGSGSGDAAGAVAGSSVTGDT